MKQLLAKEMRNGSFTHFKFSTINFISGSFNWQFNGGCKMVHQDVDFPIPIAY